MARRATLGLAVALVFGAIASAPASANTIYPGGGAKFSGDVQGWIDQQHGCNLNVLGLIVLPLPQISPVVCTTSNSYEGADGNPAGSIKTTFTAVAGLLGLIEGVSTWHSPTFTVSGTPTGATFQLDRKAAIQGAINIGADVSYTVTLRDLTDNTAQPLNAVGGKVSETDAGWVNKPTTATVKGGHQYRIEIVTALHETILQAALQPVSIGYDNIKLDVADGTDTGQVKATAVTLQASNVTATSATLNGAVDAKGLQSYYAFEYGGDANYGTTTTRTDGGSGVGPVTRSVDITGLTACTTYHFRVRAANTKNAADPLNDASQDTLGQDVIFTTNCKPTAITLPVAPISATTATLNGSVNPNGPQTSYHYEWGTTTAYGNTTSERSAGSGTDAKSPLSEPISGLTPQTTYHVRIVAANVLGTSAGEDVAFATPAQSGPGPAGANGAPGAPGKNAAAGSSNTNTTLSNGDARALLIIRSRVARVGLKGQRAGQIRLPIFCKKETGRSCAGTVKLRTRGKINPSSLGAKKTPRKVTMATFEYQLQAGRKGYAIATIQPEKLRLMRRVKTVAIDISVQVTDSNNNRQTIVQKGTFKAQNRV